MKLFRNRAFSSALGAVTAVFFAMFGVSYLLGQFIQFVQGASAFGVGLRFLPLALALLAGAALAASFAPRHSLRAVMVAGMATGTGGLAVLALVPPGSGIMLLEVPLALIGLGIGTVIAPASNAVMSSLPPDAIGAGSGLRSMVQLLGGSFGVAVLGSIATSRYRSEVHHAFHTTLAPLPPPARGPVASQIGQAIPVVKQLPPALAQITDFTVKHAFASGLHLAALAGAAFLVAAAITAAILVPHQSTAPAKGTDQPHPAKPSTDHA
jgi:MFS family permease